MVIHGHYVNCFVINVYTNSGTLILSDNNFVQIPLYSRVLYLLPWTYCWFSTHSSNTLPNSKRVSHPILFSPCVSHTLYHHIQYPGITVHENSLLDQTGWNIITFLYMIVLLGRSFSMDRPKSSCSPIYAFLTWLFSSFQPRSPQLK